MPAAPPIGNPPSGNPLIVALHFLTMSVTITTVTSARDLRRFIDLPWAIYDPETFPQWVPPLKLMVRDALDTRRNPFYRQATRELFLAWRDGRVVGRIAAIENRAHNAFHGDRVGFFGFFEAFNDPEAVRALLDTAAAWIRGRGLDVMRGPMSPSTNHDCGLLIDGFATPPTFMTTWNPPYYQALLEGAGMTKAKDLFGYFIPMADDGFDLPPQFAAHAERARAQHALTFRDVNLRDWDNELERCWGIYNAAWERNWGFIPLSKDEFVHIARELKLLLIPQFAFVAEVAGEAVGFMIVVPDFNVLFKRIRTGRLFPFGWLTLLLGKRQLRSGRVMLLGVAPAFRSRSIFQLFTHEVFRRGKAFQATGAEASWILEDNRLMTKPMETIGAPAYKVWRVYESSLT